MEIKSSQIDKQWKEAFPDAARPRLYTSGTEDENGFLPINDPESFLEDTTMMTTQQLHAKSSNNQIALKQAQDEYLEIESMLRRLAGKDSKKSPQGLQSSQEFEGRHEASLYGYKYLENNPIIRQTNHEEVTESEKRDGQHYQEAFSQGGFVPTPKQYATKLAKATDKRNPDGWKPVVKDGKSLIPKVQARHEEYSRHAPWTQEDIDAARAGSFDPENLQNGTPNRLVDKRLTRTRYDGSKVPITRDVSEDPSRAPSPRTGSAQTPNGLGKRQMTPQTAPKDGSPVPRKRQRFDNSINTGIAQSAGNTPAPNPPRPRARAGQASVPTEPLSPRSMRRWKWTNEGLLDAIRKDYLWLHPDPVKALLNKDKLLAATNPVRTWSMCNKWIDWHEQGLDKRPRNKDGATKRIDSGTIPRLGLAMVLVASNGASGNTSRPVSRGSNTSNDQSSGYKKKDTSESRNNSNVDSRPGSNAGSRKNSSAGANVAKEDLTKGSGKGSRKNSAASSRENSTASIEGTEEPIPRTPFAASNKRGSSAASTKPPSSARLTRGKKTKYAENEDPAEDETLQGMADRQLLHETVEKEEKDGDFRVRTPKNGTAPSTPARRSLRGRSQA